MPQKRLIGTDHNQVPTNAMLGSMAFQDSASVSVDTLALARGLATSPSLDFANDLDTGLYSPGDNQIALTTGGTERFRIDSSGRVGIGTTLPNEVLHVAGGGLRVAGQLVTASANSLGIDYASTSARFVSYGSDVGTQSGFVFITSNSTAGNTSERLRITSTGNVGIGITNPSAKLEVDGKVSVTTPATLSTTLGTGVSFVNASTKTYPTTANFDVTTGLEQNIELGTAQVIDTVTPGGFNFVAGLSNTLTKSAGNTQDIERLYFNGFTQHFTWTDANTCKQYVGITDTFVYSGINANGRTSSSLDAKNLSLSPPNGGTQTIANATGATRLFATVNGTSGTVNITNGYGSSVSFETAARTSGSLTATIGTYSFFGTSPLWGTSTSGTATNNTTITNLYGLRLTAPSSSTGLTVTNNWGISQEWALAKNYFAGNVGIGVTNPSTTLAVAGNTANILIGRQYTNANAITLNGSTAATDYNILSTSTNNLVINRPSAKTLIFAQADSTHAYFDTSNNLILSSGNLAMGNFTPSYAMDGGNATLNRAGRMGGLIFGTAGNSFPTMGYNAKPSGLNAWQYDISGDPASWIQFLNGSHIFYRASTGTAGAAITPLESVRFTSSGNVGIGTTDPTTLLQVGSSPNLSYSYLRVTGSGSPNKFFRFLPLAVKSTAAGVADTPQSLYVGRFYNGVHKLHLFATGSNLEEGQTLTLHRNWGSSSVPIFLTRGGSDLTEVTFHYQNIDNDSYHVFISFTWIPAAPQGQGGNIRIDISSVSNVGTFDVPTTPTIPTLDSSNQIFAQGLNVSRDTGNVGVGTTNPSFKTDVNGDMRVQGTSRVRFGGTSTTSNFSIQYNSTANSLDFIVG